MVLGAGARVFLVAGEPSGDRLGAGLMARLREARPDLEFVGVGGPAMIAEGLESLFAMEELAVMGVVEVIPRLIGLARRLRQTAAAVAEHQPAAVVTIDAPDFTMRLASRLRGQPQTSGIPRIHYVAPSVWAWRPGRADKMAGLFDRLLTLLPFEPPFFEKFGLDAVFVGHPVVETCLNEQAGEIFRMKHQIPADASLLCILPGSRRGEIARHGPVFYQVLKQLGHCLPGLHVVAPTLRSRVGEIETLFTGSTPPVRVVVGEEDKWGAFAASNLALAASGTVILELARAGTPVVVAYRLNPLTGFLARFWLRIPYVSLVNLVADAEIYPEFLQGNCTSSRLFSACLSRLSDPASVAHQNEAVGAVLRSLGSGDPYTPSERAAHAVLECLDSHFQSMKSIRR